MSNPPSLAERFDALVRSIFAAGGFEVRDTPGQRIDFLARQGDETWAVEIKYYRTSVAQVALIEAAAARLVEAARSSPWQRGMLVVSAVLPAIARSVLEERFSLAILDRTELLRLASQQPELIDELRAVLEGEVPRDAPADAPPQERARRARSLAHVDVRASTRGTELCQKLTALKPGRPTWQKYERLCEEILMYLFGDDLHGWHRQERTEDGFNRYDCVCRIKSERAFWQFLAQHLDSRYILFEFKNYTRKIKQGQVLTTEKYLFARGLRRAAIVITRAGADEGAKTVIAGSMREQGKMLLVLTDEQVCQMLQMRDDGDDPSDLLFAVTDKFLMTLPR